MSGGVDSSVAAGLLVEQGWDVRGVFMRVGHAAGGSELLPIAPRSQGCCSAVDAADARRVAGRLGIPFYALNFEAEFDRLIDRFAAQYAAARTPNPCVVCNQDLKFGRLLDYARVVGADWIATGHYARVERSGGRPRLRAAADARKDQSYVLFGISRDALGRTLFPIGGLTKDEVRGAARRLGLGVHDKPESQDICFVPDGDYAEVVRRRRPEAFEPGEIRHVDGRLLGRHDGLPRYTVGQRHGLRVAAGSPVYVTRLEPEANRVIVGPREALRSAGAEVRGVTWWIDPPEGPMRAAVRIRSNHQPAAATLTCPDRDRVEVRFDEAQSAVTPGQAAVFYEGDYVLGGGWIEPARDARGVTDRSDRGAVRLPGECLRLRAAERGGGVADQRRSMGTNSRGGGPV